MHEPNHTALVDLVFENGIQVDLAHRLVLRVDIGVLYEHYIKMIELKQNLIN